MTCCIAAGAMLKYFKNGNLLVHLYNSRRANKAKNNFPHQTKVQKWNIFLRRAI
jgi:hypothetical protein